MKPCILLYQDFSYYNAHQSKQKKMSEYFIMEKEPVYASRACKRNTGDA